MHAVVIMGSLSVLHMLLQHKDYSTANITVNSKHYCTQDTSYYTLRTVYSAIRYHYNYIMYK